MNPRVRLLIPAAAVCALVAATAVGASGRSVAPAVPPGSDVTYRPLLQDCPFPILPGVPGAPDRAFASGNLSCQPGERTKMLDFPVVDEGVNPMCNSGCENGPYRVRVVVVACRSDGGSPSNFHRVAVSGIHRGLFGAGKDAITGGWVNDGGDDGVWVWQSDCIYSDLNLPDYWRVRADFGAIQELTVSHECCNECVEYICR